MRPCNVPGHVAAATENGEDARHPITERHRHYVLEFWRLPRDRPFWTIFGPFLHLLTPICWPFFGQKKASSEPLPLLLQETTSVLSVRRRRAMDVSSKSNNNGVTKWTISQRVIALLFFFPAEGYNVKGFYKTEANGTIKAAHVTSHSMYLMYEKLPYYGKPTTESLSGQFHKESSRKTTESREKASSCKEGHWVAWSGQPRPIGGSGERPQIL